MEWKKTAVLPDFLMNFVDELEGIDWEEKSLYKKVLRSISPVFLQEFLDGGGISQRCPQIARLAALPSKLSDGTRFRLAQMFAPCVPWKLARRLSPELIELYNDSSEYWKLEASSSSQWRDSSWGAR